MPSRSKRSPSQGPSADTRRGEVAREAARIIAESGSRDFRAAKRKAAERLGASGRGDLPSNQEIEQALIAHQALFHSEAPDTAHNRLVSAAQALLPPCEHLRPRVAGDVLADSADEHSTLVVHLFTDRAEEVDAVLRGLGVRVRPTERRARYAGARVVRIPVYCLSVDDVEAELWVFAANDEREAPLSPVDGRPMRRATLKALEALVPAPRTEPIA